MVWGDEESAVDVVLQEVAEAVDVEDEVADPLCLAQPVVRPAVGLAQVPHWTISVQAAWLWESEV